MDDFMLSSRYTVQRDVIVGNSEAVPDVSHYVTEEIISSDVIISRSSDNSYYGSCGEGSPGSSVDFLEDLIEIKEEFVDMSSGSGELTVAVDLAKFHQMSGEDYKTGSKSSESDDNNEQDETDFLNVCDEVVIDSSGSGDDEFISFNDNKRYVFLTKDGKPATSLDDLKEHKVELTDIYSKPKLSYAQLIAEALMTAEGRMLTLSEIYTSVAERHPYYKMDHSRNWQNAIRHNLTLNKCFTKVPRPAAEGRGSFWRLEDGSEVLIFKRILARHQQQQNRLKISQPTVQTFDPARDIVYVTIPDD